MKNRTGLSLVRVGLVARQTLAEAAGQRMFPLLLALAVLLAGAATLLRAINFGEAGGKFLLDAGLGAQAFFGTILAAVATAQLFFAELERKSVHMVLARPVSRTEFILGKLGGVLLLLLGFCAATTLLTVGILAWSGVKPAAGAGEAVAGTCGLYCRAVLGGLAHWLKLGVLAAMTLLVASYARSSLFAILAGFFALVVCELQHLAYAYYGMLGSPVARAAVRLLHVLVPDFRVFDLGGGQAGGMAVSAGRLGGMTIYALGYIAVFAALAAWCFRRREL